MNAAELLAEPSGEALVRHIIEFDPRDPAHYRFAAEPNSADAAELAAAVQADPIPWPDGLAPSVIHPNPAPTDTDPLPAADALVVTYTVAEGYAAADVLTPGLSTKGWTPYRNGWTTLKKSVKKGAPSLQRDQAGLWALTSIGSTTVVVVKSDLHPSTDGVELPIRALWKQMIDQVKPRLVITTGTAGGIGADTVLGDVIVSQNLRWDCSKTFADADFAHSSYSSTGPLDTTLFPEAVQTLIPVNAKHLPPSSRAPTIVTSADSGAAQQPVAVLTTDFFAFDDAADHYGLRSYEPDARAVEMDDAACALACTDLTDPPTWVSVRNASDPQVSGPTLAAEKKLAAEIYEKYGYWTTVGSAITTWALAAG